MKYGFQFNKKILEESLAFGGKKIKALFGENGDQSRPRRRLDQKG